MFNTVTTSFLQVYHCRPDCSMSWNFSPINNIFRNQGQGMNECMCQSFPQLLEICAEWILILATTCLSTPIFCSLTVCIKQMNHLLSTTGYTFVGQVFLYSLFSLSTFKWSSSWDYGTYHIGDHRRLRRACRICAVSSEPLLFAHMKYGSRRRVRPKIRHLAPLDGCSCAFEERVYWGRKVP